MFAQAYTMQFKAVTCFPPVASQWVTSGWEILNHRWSAGFLDIVTHSYMFLTKKAFISPGSLLTSPFEFSIVKKEFEQHNFAFWVN